MAERESKKVTRWDPFHWDPFEGADWFPSLRRARGELAELFGREGRFLPAMDIAEDDGNYVVTAELPGTKREDVTVELKEGMLSIRGEKKSEREEKKEHRRYVERSYGTFSRAFSLPSDADQDRVQAAFKDGVLTVTIGKTAETKPKTVDIKAS
jgi:HSP20 family protein